MFIIQKININDFFSLSWSMLFLFFKVCQLFLIDIKIPPQLPIKSCPVRLVLINPQLFRLSSRSCLCCD